MVFGISTTPLLTNKAKRYARFASPLRFHMSKFRLVSFRVVLCFGLILLVSAFQQLWWAWAYSCGFRRFSNSDRRRHLSRLWRILGDSHFSNVGGRRNRPKPLVWPSHRILPNAASEAHMGAGVDRTPRSSRRTRRSSHRGARL